MAVGQIAILSANLGGFDKAIATYTVSDSEYPPRANSMTPRLQARIVKTHMWQFEPDYELYLWIDSSCRLTNEDSVQWFVDQLGDNDIAVFKHPQRNTVREEAKYLKERLELERAGRKQKYILPRYDGEDIDGQLAEVDPDGMLFASTAFIYRLSPQVKAAMKEWWYQISRYHSIDQLSLPWAIEDLKVKVINENYADNKGIQYVRNK